MSDKLSEECVRASWEAERDNMRQWCLKEKKFNPKSVERFIDNFIDSMAFARIPCGSTNGIAASWNQFKRENARDH